jgi:P4 family phage/plasmid primase-like protien
MLDSVQYREKPKGAAGAIKSRLATTCANPLNLSPDALREFVEHGGTFCPAIIRPTTNEKGALSHNAAGFAAQQVFCVDIDNDEQATVDGKKQKRRLPDSEYIESAKALEICEACGVAPFMMYHSFSSSPDLEKYRICVVLPDPITDDTEREHVVSAFVSMFGRATDSSCTNADRIFFGSGADSVFMFNPDAVTQKSAFLDLWELTQQQKQSGGAEPLDNIPDSPELDSPARSAPATAPPARDSRFDADPATLLNMIDPNGLTYSEWQKITGAFINSGGRRSDWDAWCSRYADNSTRENERVWNSSGKSGKHGKATAGTLKRSARAAAPIEYENYMNSLKEAQRAERKRARREAIMEEFGKPLDRGSDQGQASGGLDQTEGTTADGKKVLPWYFYMDDHDRIRVDPAKLWQHIQRNETFFWVTNSAMEGVRRYFYNKKRGVYELMGDNHIKGLIQEYISREAPSLVKSRDVNEVFNLLTNEATDPKTGESRYKLDSYLDNNENLVNFENGFFDLRTWTMYQHQNSIISTVQLPLSFDPSRTYTLDDAPTFRNYLQDLTEGDQQKQQLLLEYMGAALSNIPGYRFKSALFLVGDPNAGKSQIILLICKLLGLPNTAKVNFSELCERFQSGTIYGKRLVHDPDMKVKQKAADTSLFKNVTGGDPIQIEFKGLNPFTTIHRGYFLFASNDFPKWSGGTDEAMYNRMLVIECRNPIPVNKRDPQLLDKMYSERQAIVSIAFQALCGAVQRGYRFTRPAALDQTLQQLRCENCPSIDFFETQCIQYDDAATNEKHRIRTRTLHEAFAKWCKTNSPSAYIPTSREFYRDILKYLHLPDGSLKKCIHGNYFYTFTLTPDAKEELGYFDSIE